jgi:hypothetical protein
MADERGSTAGAASDTSILEHIRTLVDEERDLYEHNAPTEADLDRLQKINVELDRYWDLLRQRRALREFGRDPAEARMRGTGVVEKYEG